MIQYPQPEAVFRYFSALAAIPHGSGNTAGIRKWAIETAKSLSLDVSADAAGNVIIRKQASAGYEQHPAVILQGHLDMVCAKLPECSKNMDKEGIDLVWGDEYLSADGTTLGGDDGIAIAYAFAILERDDIPHPPLTVIFTMDEETGMDGASALSPDVLDSTYFINLDSEEEGIFTVGCAGGVRVHIHLPVQSRKCSGTRICLTVSGLIGGHSGAEIHKNRLNANLVMLRLLRAVPQRFCLCSWQGGVRDNVIPTDCTAMLICDPKDITALLAAIQNEAAAIRNEHPEEKGFVLDMDTPVKSAGIALTSDSTACLLETLFSLPNGVQAMNPQLGMPETSLNLGIFMLKDSIMQVDALIRSSINAEKERLASKLHVIAEKAGGTAHDSGCYPAWEYVPDTALESSAVSVYQSLFGKKPVIQTIHAGLECGILTAKAPQLQCISIGPDLLDIHTPRERLSIASAGRTWDFLLALLKAL